MTSCSDIACGCVNSLWSWGVSAKNMTVNAGKKVLENVHLPDSIQQRTLAATRTIVGIASNYYSPATSAVTAVTTVLAPNVAEHSLKLTDDAINGLWHGAHPKAKLAAAAVGLGLAYWEGIGTQLTSPLASTFAAKITTAETLKNLAKEEQAHEERISVAPANVNPIAVQATSNKPQGFTGHLWKWWDDVNQPGVAQQRALAMARTVVGIAAKYYAPLTAVATTVVSVSAPEVIGRVYVQADQLISAGWNMLNSKVKLVVCASGLTLAYLGGSVITVPLSMVISAKVAAGHALDNLEKEEIAHAVQVAGASIKGKYTSTSAPTPQVSANKTE